MSEIIFQNHAPPKARYFIQNNIVLRAPTVLECGVLAVRVVEMESMTDGGIIGLIEHRRSDGKTTYIFYADNSFKDELLSLANSGELFWVGGNFV